MQTVLLSRFAVPFFCRGFPQQQAPNPPQRVKKYKAKHLNRCRANRCSASAKHATDTKTEKEAPPHIKKKDSV